MAFLTRAGNHLLTNKLILFPARQDLPALMDPGHYHHSIHQGIHHAREQVLLFINLQIPVNDIARSSGNELMNE